MADIRPPWAGVIHVGTTLSASKAVNLHDISGGHIHIPATEGAVTLDFYFADDDVDDPTFNRAHDQTQTAISIAGSGGNCYAFPEGCFGKLATKIVASAISGGTTIAYRITGTS